MQGSKSRLLVNKKLEVNHRMSENPNQLLKVCCLIDTKVCCNVNVFINRIDDRITKINKEAEQIS